MKIIAVAIIILILAGAAGFWYGKNSKPFVKTNVPTTPEASKEANSPWLQCTDVNHHFTISYPWNWTLNPTDNANPCSVFTPDAGATNPSAQIKIAVVAPLGLDKLQEVLMQSNEERILLSSKSLLINDRDAVRLETEATGTGTAPKGTRTVQFLIKDKINSFAISFQEITPNPDREKIITVLDQMLKTLTF